MTSRELADEAESFAQTVAHSVSVFTGRNISFEATAVGEKIMVRQAGEESATYLSVKSEPLLKLDVEFKCDWDSTSIYLAVLSSSVKILPPGKDKAEPLFRYEYQRDVGLVLPAAHLHIHAHRNELAYAMARAGSQGIAKRRKGKTVHQAESKSKLSELHFPLGGHRFRPCLEDVLAMVHAEFGVDTGPGWEKLLKDQRAEWRRMQTSAVVRDAPEVAAKELASLGYNVTPPIDGHPEEKLDRLTCL
jgi:hypothetical protein